MTRRKTGVARCGARGADGGRGCRRGTAPAATRDADRDRLGVRRQRRMAPFDGPRSRRRRSASSRSTRRAASTAASCRSRPATPRATSPRSRSSCAAKLLGAGRERHLHDLRRRLRGPGRAGGDQPGRPRGRAVHRHRPDGAEALRREGPARVQRSATWRRTRARPWRSTRGARGGRPRALATDTVIVYFKNVVKAFEARFKQLGGKIVDKETYQSLGGERTSRTRSAG